MKSTVVPIHTIESELSRKDIIAGLVELSKARLSLMVILTSAAGFYMGHKGNPDWFYTFCMTISGTALLAISAAALNQVLEISHDSNMDRTKDRPLVTRLFSTSFAVKFGIITATLGFSALIAGANPLTAILGLATLIIYLFVYTPLKRISIWNTLVGALPGALPPLMGWTAATGQIDSKGLLLFLLLFAWQIPHFMAIAWMYKDDYQKAGFKMLPSIDINGHRCGRHAVVFSFCLTQVGLLMARQQMVGVVYVILGSLLALGMLVFSIWFCHRPSHKTAKMLFLSSIIYLPFQLLLMVFDKNS